MLKNYSTIMIRLYELYLVLVNLHAMKKQVFILVFLCVGSMLHAQIMGCTDPLSKNYNPEATINDGSCEYKQASVAPILSVDLTDETEETSGLILWNDSLYTHNDNTDINLYALDTVTGGVLRTISLKGSVNKDWEDIAQDDDYLYIGDFGNNVSGNRTDLNILKVSKASLRDSLPKIEKINFSYSDQEDLTKLKSNTTNFDCEAMVVSRDSIYLFTKQWSAKNTSVYTLPKSEGTYIARLKTTFDVKGLITGAAYLEDKKLLVLCGYSGMVQPFFYLLYDFKGYDFFSGNKRKIIIDNMSFHQVEGIATLSGLDYFVTNEHLVKKPFVNVMQKLHKFNLADFLKTYLKSNISAENN